MDLFEDAPGPGEGEGGNAHEFTVSEISGAVKRTLESEFGWVKVRGEVGRVSRPRTGHIYFDLKDDRSCLAAVTWKGQAARLRHLPEEGMEVVATGRMTTFGPQSKYQLVVEDIRPAGAGALMAMLEERRKKLATEGLFDAARKRPLPFLPEVIGVVTSPTGAVIRDILHRLRDRFPRKVLVWPVAVQGRGSAEQVAAAIEGFNRLSRGGALPRPDVLIVARGGGSLEDLWGFNEEIVVRAAAGSAIPLISAVGHETDTTLIDHAADYRAPTPTAAAERAVPVRLDLMAATESFGARLAHAAGQGVAQRRQRLTDLGRALPRPETLLAGPQQRLDNLGDRLPGALRAATHRKAMELARLPLSPATLSARVRHDRRVVGELEGRGRAALTRQVERARERLARRTDALRPETMAVRLARLSERLDGLGARLRPALVTTEIARERARLESLDRLRETLGYEATLARGFAVVRAGDAVVTRAAEAERAPALELQFRDGRVTVGRGPAPRRKGGEPDEGQGTLL
ncbi:exodeoxyribonuclease VII large subunit [Wenxinia marina]|uniref:Exodeoxyribonuclease 7 large subunit n=1 Tax=Wenxinia marina DSM 24838 TaxID=1123501 RepID=A0A0D0Q6T5_9RHOB|nr:exodeoxyribonuclease VII large subunit [Wenxinia marina]KIQ68147.1 Exodeoxyribonuclease VII large subunit [Wenxinia marina DSM 24838]GGL78639.1 exodeoxyribonuclease 7 large subunit [Wenxinia marina]